MGFTCLGLSGWRNSKELFPFVIELPNKERGYLYPTRAQYFCCLWHSNPEINTVNFANVNEPSTRKGVKSLPSKQILDEAEKAWPGINFAPATKKKSFIILAQGFAVFPPDSCSGCKRGCPEASRRGPEVRSWNDGKCVPETAPWSRRSGTSWWGPFWWGALAWSSTTSSQTSTCDVFLRPEPRPAPSRPTCYARDPNAWKPRKFWIMFNKTSCFRLIEFTTQDYFTKHSNIT